MLTVLLVAAALRPPVAQLTWDDFFSAVQASGVTYSDRVRALDGHRVRVRGYAVLNPPLEHGVLLTRFGHQDPHGVEETDVPFDAVAVLWRSGLATGPVPRRPTVEGILRLGNRDVGPVIVSITLEDATPVMPQR